MQLIWKDYYIYLKVSETDSLYIENIYKLRIARPKKI